MKNRTTLVLVALLLVASFAVGSMWTRIRYLEGEKEAKKPEEKKEATAQQPSEVKVLGEEAGERLGLGNFDVYDEEVCKEDGKPIVYYFGRSSCPHCIWEHPVLEKAVKDFSDFISFHDDMDKLDNLGKDTEVYAKYSRIYGGVPLIVMGCKYAQVGSGEQWGEEEETKNLQAVLCKLTEGRPEAVCGQVSDYIDKIQE